MITCAYVQEKTTTTTTKPKKQTNKNKATLSSDMFDWMKFVQWAILSLEEQSFLHHMRLLMCPLCYFLNVDSLPVTRKICLAHWSKLSKSLPNWGLADRAICQQHVFPSGNSDSFFFLFLVPLLSSLLNSCLACQKHFKNSCLLLALENSTGLGKDRKS